MSWVYCDALAPTPSDPLRETAILPCACARGTRQRPKSPRQMVCRVPHTAKGTRQIAIGKGTLCRVQYSGHTSKLLPCALANPRQIFLADYQADVARDVCRVSPGSGTRQRLNLCRVPRSLHTAKYGPFAVCLGQCTRQRWLILYFFYLLRIWYPK